ARGGVENVAYPWGNEFSDVAGFPAEDNFVLLRVTSSDLPNIRFGYLLPHLVGSFKPNGFGLSNMGGNVSEWCEDFYDVNYYKHRPAESPRCGDPSSGQRVVRGGNYKSEVTVEGTAGQDVRYRGESVRVARRDHCPPTFISATVGFRLAMDAQ
ncbi:MAG: SUMF1/EgtB/PvdO family nonheme iron enzyme, partial [bacterium]